MLIDKNSIKFNYINLYTLSKENIGIPIFQRFYSWKEKQIHETLDDLLECICNNDKEIYLLDFIWYKEDGKIKLADGQQRIVSINLIIKAITDYASANKIVIDEIRPFNISYDNIEYQKKYNQTFTNYVVAPFKKMYAYLLKFVEEHKENLNSFINTLKNRIYIYMKETESSDAAFTIFTQINTGGKPLTKDEVIKTAIDQYSSVYQVPVNSGVKQLRKAITSYYKFVNTSYSSNFDSIEIMGFLKNHIVIDKHSFADFANYLQILSKISNYSIYHIIEYINRSQLFDVLNIMAIKKIDVNKERGYLTDVMFPLCLLSVAMTMKKSNPGGIIRSLYSSIISLVKEGKNNQIISEKIASFINDNAELCKITFNDFTECLGKKEISTKLKEALLIMDVILHTASSDLNMDCINLEHIYPQNPAPKWAMNGWPTSNDDRGVLIHNIGNYLLLNESINKKIKNKYIDEKIDEYNRIIPHDITLKTPMNTVDFNKFEAEKEKYIFARQKNIAEMIYNEFPLAKVIILK